MDIQLPIMDGYEATRRIKADASLRSIPIIAVTSYALSVEGQKARVAGCDDYVPKPFSPRQLLAKIRQYIAPMDHDGLLRRITRCTPLSRRDAASMSHTNARNSCLIGPGRMESGLFPRPITRSPGQQNFPSGGFTRGCNGALPFCQP